MKKILSTGIIILLTASTIYGITQLKNIGQSLLLLPRGNLVNRYDSPDGKLRLCIYIVRQATVSDCVRGELVDENNNKRDIYWNYKESSAEVAWLDNTHVTINGVTLDVLSEIYDYRNGNVKNGTDINKNSFQPN